MSLMPLYVFVKIGIRMDSAFYNYKSIKISKG